MDTYEIGDIMTKRPVVASPMATVREVSELMARRKVGSILLAQKGMLAGIITERDIVRKVNTLGLDVNKAIVSSYMTPAAQMVTITPTKDVQEALAKMNDHSVRHLPVIAGAELVGLLTLKDILRWQPAMYEIVQEKFEQLPEKLT